MPKTRDNLYHFPGSGMTALDFRCACDAYHGRDWWDANYPQNAILMAIGLCHTNLSMDYRKNGARGMYAIDPGVFGGEDTVATDAQSIWCDPDVIKAVLLPGQGFMDMTDWIAAFLNQNFWSENAAIMAWRHPSPWFTVWDENCVKGMEIVSPETIDWQSSSAEWRSASDQNYSIVLFKDSAGEFLFPSTQEMLWRLASKAACYAELWWNPVKARRVIKRALSDFSADGKSVNVGSMCAAALAMGDGNMAVRLAEYHAAIVYSMTRHPWAWLPMRTATADGYTRETIWSWVRGDKAGKTAEELLRGTADGLTDFWSGLFGGGGVLWLLAGGLALGWLIYYYRKGGKAGPA